MSKSKVQKRIHPGVAIAAIVSLASMAIVAELLGNPNGEVYKIGAAAAIASITGIKIRRYLPVT